jgi:hypothetical protein
MAGFDVLFPKELDDDGLVELCRSTDRYLLTRDKDLSGRKMVRSIRLCSEDVDGQLKEMTLKFPDIQGRSRASRCPLCNVTLSFVEREALKDIPDAMVPEKVLEFHRTFFHCQKCAKTYWKGTHWARIETMLRSHGLVIDDPGEIRTEK